LPCERLRCFLSMANILRNLQGSFRVGRTEGCGFRKAPSVTDRPNKLGPIRLGYGSITVRTLREFYGSFAPHLADNKTLNEVLDELDVASLNQLTRDFKSGKLAKICQEVPWLSGLRPAKADSAGQK
jgi:hypothetical protein